ncbi:MAG: hypothetical protein WAU73_27705 [Candidatus Sulfotelmatobacter sp.]
MPEVKHAMRTGGKKARPVNNIGASFNQGLHDTVRSDGSYRQVRRPALSIRVDPSASRWGTCDTGIWTKRWRGRRAHATASAC